MPVFFQKLIAPKGLCAFIIRDDDLNFFTRPFMLEKLYNKAWTNGFKVSFCVVPCQKAIPDLPHARAFFVPPEARGTGRYYSISENQNLVDYLNHKISNGEVSIALHGYSHEYWDNRGLAEFAITQTTELERRIKVGLHILRKDFDQKVRVFVPPNESLSSEALKIVKNHDLVVLRRKSLIDTLLAYVPSPVSRPIVDMLVNVYLKQGNKQNFDPSYLKPAVISPHVSRFSKIDELQWSLPLSFLIKLRSTRIAFELAKKIFLYTYQNRGCFSYFHHYYLYFYDWEKCVTRREMFNHFHLFLNYVAKFPMVWKTTFEEFVERANLVEQVKIVQTGSKIKLSSPTTVNDLGLRLSSDQEIKSNNCFIIEHVQNHSKIITIPVLKQDRSVSIEFK